MDNITDIKKQDRITRAKAWLKRARKDYRGYTKVVGQQYIRSKKSLPDDPALAVYLLQQSAEKTVKAVAIASGEFETKELKLEYGHNSLMLLSDIMIKVLEIPIVEPLIRLMKISLGQKGGKLLDIVEARARFQEIKQNIAKDRSPDTPDWLKEFALLPSEQIKPIVIMLLKLRGNIQSSIHKILRTNLRFDVQKMKDYLDNTTESNLRGVFAPSFRDSRIPPDALAFALNTIPIFTGIDFRQSLESAINEDSVDLRRISPMLEKRNILEEQFLSVWALCSLMFLAAFTFAHESWARYPNSERKDLDYESYTGEIGIVSCLNELGQLMKDTVYDIEDMLETIADVFSHFRR